jgi:hypothetical protein
MRWARSCGGEYKEQIPHFQWNYFGSQERESCKFICIYLSQDTIWSRCILLTVLSPHAVLKDDIKMSKILNFLQTLTYLGVRSN